MPQKNLKNGHFDSRLVDRITDSEKPNVQIPIYKITFSATESFTPAAWVQCNGFGDPHNTVRGIKIQGHINIVDGLVRSSHIPESDGRIIWRSLGYSHVNLCTARRAITNIIYQQDLLIHVQHDWMEGTISPIPQECVGMLRETSGLLHVSYTASPTIHTFMNTGGERVMQVQDTELCQRSYIYSFDDEWEFGFPGMKMLFHNGYQDIAVLTHENGNWKPGPRYQFFS